MRILSIILSASSFSAAFVRSSSRGDVPLLSSSTALSHSSSSRTPGELDDMNDIVKARTAISEAIAVGAPAYNRGDIRKCAEVYLETARGMSNLELPKSLRDRLKSEVDGGITDATNYNDKAWALREVFDAIMEYQPPIVPRDSSQEAEVNMEPFTPAQLGEARNVMDSVWEAFLRAALYLRQTHSLARHPFGTMAASPLSGGGSRMLKTGLTRREFTLGR